MAEHSFLPPSGASAWVRCALWPTMNARYPQADSAASIEGTAAHWVATTMLDPQIIQPKAGDIAPNGVSVTDEMVEGGELVRDTVRARMPGLKLHIEERIAATRIHPDCFGTPDVWAHTGASHHIEILDYKYGHGFVDEYFNWQGLAYLAGILESAYDVDKFPNDITVSFTIVQPRCYYGGSPVRTHDFSVKDIPPYMLRLRDAASAAMQPTPTATTNPECCHCAGRHACSALQRAAYSDAEFADDRQPFDLSPQAAALELRMLERAYDRLGSRVDGLKELTLANIRAGKSVPYYKLEPGRGKVAWTVPDEQVITLGQMFGKDLSKPGVLTVTQARKLGIDEGVTLAYSQIIPGSQKLVAQNNVEVRKVFTHGE